MTYILIPLILLAVIQYAMLRAKKRKIKNQVLGSKLNELLAYIKEGKATYVDDKNRNLLHLIALEDVAHSKSYSGMSYGDLIKKALEAGVNVNGLDLNGNAPLHLACQRMESIDTFNLLVEGGANVDMKNVNGTTPLMIVSSLVEDLNLYAGSAFDKLVDKVNCLNETDKSGWTALMYAVKDGNIWTINKLLDKGANASLINSDGQAAYDLADKRKHYRTSSKPGGDVSVERHNFGIDETIRRLKCAKEGSTYKARKFVRQSSSIELE
jgi:hypothetical protein